MSCRGRDVSRGWLGAVLCVGSSGRSLNHEGSKRSKGHRRKRVWPSVWLRLDWRVLPRLTQWSRRMKKKSLGSCKSEPLAQAVNLCTTHGLLGLREFFMFLLQAAQPCATTSATSARRSPWVSTKNKVKPFFYIINLQYNIVNTRCQVRNQLKLKHHVKNLPPSVTKALPLVF